MAGQEQQLQSKIIKLLHDDGWLVVKTIQLSVNGYPDLFCFKNSRSVFLEIKSPTGKATELQKYRIEQLQTQGFTAGIVRSIEDFKNIINVK